MAADDDARGTTLQTVSAEGESQETTVPLAGGRTLTVREGAEQILELRNPGGLLELRIRLTDEGPVLAIEGAKVAIRAAETVSVECKRFEVKAEEDVSVAAQGHLDLTSEKEMKVTSTDDVRVVGKMIHLN